MENFYEMIGTSENAIKNKRLSLEKEGLERRKIDEYLDNFIKEKYEHTIRLIQMRKKILEEEILNFEQILQGIAEKKEQAEEKMLSLEQQELQITEAYEQIATRTLRDLYNVRMNEKMERQGLRRNKIINFETVAHKKRNFVAYDVLNLLEESFKFNSEEENNKKILLRKQELVNLWMEKLEKVKDFNARIKIETNIKEIEEAYELIKTGEKRKKYDAQLQQERQKNEDEMRKKKIEKKYSHIAECNLRLINNIKKSTQEFLWNKMVERVQKQANEYFYKDEQGRQLSIRETGQIRFLTGNRKMFLNEYEVTRMIEGKEIKDIIYTNSIKPFYLSVDKKTGEPIYSEYYNCIVNELLSEELTEGSKYNGGYIGEIEKDQEGNYITTLGGDKLRPTEKEYLTAVMIVRKREEMKLEKNKEKGAEK